MSGPWEREDIVSIIGGLFDTNAKLERVAQDVAAIRDLLDENDDEEEAQEDG